MCEGSRWLFNRLDRVYKPKRVDDKLLESLRVKIENGWKKGDSISIVEI